MTLGSTLRKTVFLAAAMACLSTWIITGAAFWFDWHGAVRGGALVVALLATEELLWLSVALLGWTAFANRGLFWRRFGLGGRA